MWPGNWKIKCIIKQNLKRLFSIVEIILHEEPAYTLSDNVLLIYSHAVCVCVLFYWRYHVSQNVSCFGWNASKRNPELGIGVGTRNISRLLGYCLKMFYVCDPYIEQGELLFIYSKKFTFIILKINHRVPHLKMSLGIIFANPWSLNMNLIYPMLNGWSSNKFWNEDM